jgi:hypothetical protein
MQHYIRRRQIPIMKTMDDRWEAVRSRPNVQAALAKFGRVERFDVVAPAY